MVLNLQELHRYPLLGAMLDINAGRSAIFAGIWRRGLSRCAGSAHARAQRGWTDLGLGVWRHQRFALLIVHINNKKRGRLQSYEH